MYINSSREKILKLVLSTSGIFGIVFSLYLSYGLYFNQWNDPFSLSSFKTYFLILSCLYVFINCFTGINKSFLNRGQYREVISTFYIILMLVSLLILILFWMHRLFDSHRLVIGYFSVIFLVLDSSSRFLIKILLIKIYLKSKFAHRLLVITDMEHSNDVLSFLKNNIDWSRQIFGVSVIDMKDDERLDSIQNYKVVSRLDDLLEYVTQNNVDEVFVYTNEVYSNPILKEHLSNIEEMGIRVNIRINIDLFEYLPNSYIKVDKIGLFQCVSVSRNFYSYQKIFAKHILDYIGGVVGFLIFCVVYLILAPIIKFDSKGPVIFAQPRIGKNGRVFNCYKFRSMRTDAEMLKKNLMKENEMQGLMFKIENDPRITKVGKFIRKTSIDELPQFINVLKGDMSLVGTRPPTVDEYEKYEPKHKARVSMTTGLTGLWQISGRSEIKNFDDVINLDMKYIDNWSIWLDIKIILLTIKVVIFRCGAK